MPYLDLLFFGLHEQQKLFLLSYIYCTNKHVGLAAQLSTLENKTRLVPFMGGHFLKGLIKSKWCIRNSQTAQRT